MTRKNAENSQSAADVMSAVDRHVKEGNRTLGQMVVSMDEINSSDKISKISRKPRPMAIAGPDLVDSI